MGINLGTFHFLLHNRQYINGSFLMLGRQGIHLSQSNRHLCLKMAERYDSIENFNSAVNLNDTYAEKLFAYFGASDIQSMDVSNYEDASIIHDMNVPIPSELENQFDTIFDGGTLEHVFDVKTALENVKKMLKIDGVFIAISPANNFLGHGFYQFSPELYRTVFSEDAGYRIEKYQLMYNRPPNDYRIEDLVTPNRDERQQISTESSEVSNCVIVRKLKNVSLGNFQQSDYVAEWNQKKV